MEIKEKENKQPVLKVEKRAYWIHNGEYWMCSNCSWVTRQGPQEHCPQCGARMNGN